MRAFLLRTKAAGRPVWWRVGEGGGLQPLLGREGDRDGGGKAQIGESSRGGSQLSALWGA